MKKWLTIIHTNDLHAEYDQAVRQTAYIKRRVAELEARGESYLLVDGGDHLDMSINECLVTRGKLHLNMLKETGYHAMSVGNNELLRSTPDLIREHSLETPVPWLMLNLVEGDGTPIGGMRETLMMTLENGMKIGLFGATDQFGDLYENKHGFRNLDTIQAVKNAVAELKEQGADFIIFLSHLGYEADLTNAKELIGLVDVVVGGHSHTVLQTPVMESGMLIVQAGSHGKFVGELKLEVNFENGKHQIEAYDGKLVEIHSDSEADLDMEAIVEKGREETDEFLSEVLFESSEPLSHRDVVQLMAESVRSFWEAEVGIMYGGAAVEGLGTGEITKGDVLTVCKSMHSPVLMELTGDQIAGLVADSLKEEITSKLVYGNGFRPHGISIGSLAFSGLEWTFRDGVISDIRINGETLRNEQVYTVGSGSPMLYEEVCGYSSVKGNRLLKVENILMVKDVFMRYLTGQGDRFLVPSMN
ncbi:bifunctional metallophosphatase/5'-nucleotidase [Falsibacillus pallidus]|uniref:2',3'-cyclic-nucleotide 2'-phosphodiesterase (5'-nucleotidase family) n=1 Tax=Falsibacillus pallidus TaxID=493781 RepID=A0A370G0K9_9BACI|nr:metallophosphoesterase [Falsibacillus pallidus]RDI36439.1 2',3'-cyclic-nucleotide 2'-phosphodiesterase (5'-nucleotidase family) [Falsibacillus pallidus]